MPQIENQPKNLHTPNPRQTNDTDNGIDIDKQIKTIEGYIKHFESRGLNKRAEYWRKELAKWETIKRNQDKTTSKLGETLKNLEQKEINDALWEMQIKFEREKRGYFKDVKWKDIETELKSNQAVLKKIVEADKEGRPYSFFSKEEGHYLFMKDMGSSLERDGRIQIHPLKLPIRNPKT